MNAQRSIKSAATNDKDLNNYSASLSDFLVELRRNTLKICTLLILFECLACLYIYLTPATYAAASTILLENQAVISNSTDKSAAGYGDLLDNARADSQMQVIKSERLLRYVFDTLKLAESKAIDPEKRSIILYLFDSIGFSSGKRDSERSTPNTDVEALYERFSRKVGTRRVGQSYVIEVSFSSADPKTASHLTNSIAMAYIRQQIAAKFSVTQNGSEYLQGRVQSFAKQLEEATLGMREGIIPDVLFPDADARVIGAAAVPTAASSPQRVIAIVFAAVLSIFVSCVAIIVRFNFKQLLRSGSKISKISGYDFLGSIQSDRLGNFSRNQFFRRQLNKDPWLNLDASSAKVLDEVVPIIRMGAKRKRKTIGIVSWGENNGRELVSVLLAQRLAESSQPVKIIEPAESMENYKSIFADKIIDETGASKPVSAQRNSHTWLPPGVQFVRVARSGSIDKEINSFHKVDFVDLESFISEDSEKSLSILNIPATSCSPSSWIYLTIVNAVIAVVEQDTTSIAELRELVDSLDKSGTLIYGVIMIRRKD